MRQLGIYASSFLLAAILTLPAWGLDTNKNSAVPGTLNYVEGQAEIGNEALKSKSIGNVELQPGQTVNTQTGKAEILLTPGVFLRVGNNSTVRMISPSLTNTQVQIESGHAMVEVAEIHPENNIRVIEDGATAKLLKTGLYDFNQAQDEIRVFDGKASVQDGDKTITVKRNHELAVENGAAKTHKFHKKDYEQGDLYRWSSLRSGYLAEANVDAASLYAENDWSPWGYGWGGAGWYWDPYFDAFTFIPGGGIFYSPFGWGFYSPFWVYQSPLYGWYGRGYQHSFHHFSMDYHNWGPGNHYVASNHYAHGIYRGSGSIGRGFHSSGFAMRSGSRGFGGGFHGGGGGGGRHSR